MPRSRLIAPAILFALSTLAPSAWAPTDRGCLTATEDYPSGRSTFLVATLVPGKAPYYRITPADGYEVRDGNLLRPDEKYPDRQRFEYGNLFQFADQGKREALLAEAGVTFERDGSRIVAIRVPVEAVLNERLRDAKYHVQYHTGADMKGIIPHLRLAELLAEGKIGVAFEPGREWFHDRLTHLPQYLLMGRYKEIMDPLREYAAELVRQNRDNPSERVTEDIENLISTLDTDGNYVLEAAVRKGGTRADEVDFIANKLHYILSKTPKYRGDPPALREMTKRVAAQIYDSTH